MLIVAFDESTSLIVSTLKMNCLPNSSCICLYRLKVSNKMLRRRDRELTVLLKYRQLFLSCNRTPKQLLFYCDWWQVSSRMLVNHSMAYNINLVHALPLVAKTLLYDRCVLLASILCHVFMRHS